MNYWSAELQNQSPNHPITNSPDDPTCLLAICSRAMLSPDLLEILVCPACHANLDYSEPRQTLTCTACRRVYPIRDGLPILLIDQATIEPRG